MINQNKPIPNARISSCTSKQNHISLQMLVLEMFLCRILSFRSSLFAFFSSRTRTQVCKDTHPRQIPGRKEPLSSMQGDGDKGSYISHLDFLRIQTWMAWPVGKAPVLMSRTHVLPQVVMHLFSLFPLEQKKIITNTSLMGLPAPRDERKGKSWTRECSNCVCRKLQTTRNKAFNT